MLKNKIVVVLLILLSLPILLPLYNPSMELGALGMILGIIGTFISPVVIFGTFGYLLVQAFRPSSQA